MATTKWNQVLYEQELLFGYSCNNSCKMFLLDQPIFGGTIHLKGPGTYRLFAATDNNELGEQIHFFIDDDGRCRIIAQAQSVPREQAIQYGHGITKDMISNEKEYDEYSQDLERRDTVKIYIPSSVSREDITLSCKEPCHFEFDGNRLEDGEHIENIAPGAHTLIMHFNAERYLKYTVSVTENSEYNVRLVDPIEKSEGCDTPIIYRGKCKYENAVR